LSQLVGRPTDRSAVVSVLSSTDREAFIEFGPAADRLTAKTPVRQLKAGEPFEFELANLAPNAANAYRLRTRAGSSGEFDAQPVAFIQTHRPPGSAFTFAVQGDSHPERIGRMYDPTLYAITMRNVAKDRPDFYFMMGDDFSTERLIEQKTITQRGVDAIYAHQRVFLGLVGQSTPVMLVNGNHEQAARYLLDGTATNPAVFAGKARTRFFPLPAPDRFYTGNTTPVEHVGLLRDYYAWTWGDALFVVIDPYWHSPQPVDNEAGVQGGPQRGEERRPRAGEAQPKGEPENRQDGQRRKRDAGEEPSAERGGKRNRDLWQITLGDQQYQWLSQTLRESKSKFKFVFSHHVLGTGRGGVEVAGRFEWGGDDQRGVDRFAQMRPTWEKPIHDLMRDTGVTIFFQGHDHLYARQELEGVIYQSCPNPADPTFTAFNREAYRSGDIRPNSGHLRVSVSPEKVRVEYVRTFPGEETTGEAANGSIAHAYDVLPRTPAGGTHSPSGAPRTNPQPATSPGAPR
jgi:hypothetical protein